MRDLLFLSHRIPFPPNKGDKIRSYHLLHHLASHYRVHLGAFIDDPDDEKYIPEMKALCSSVCFVKLRQWGAWLRSGRALISGKPLTFAYFWSAFLDEWITSVLRDIKPDCAVVFSSAMAPYLVKHKYSWRRKVLDLVDVDSDKWRQYSCSQPWPLSFIYRREAILLDSAEREFSQCFDTTVLVSDHEAEFFRQRAPQSAHKVVGISNGVDTEYFSPHGNYPDPYQHGRAVLVFTGAMDYWANVDAVCWFANHVWPEIRTRVRHAQFYIVGSRPTSEVRALANHDGIVVTGRVEDVRPYLQHARMAVAPLRIARGIQNKILEALAMGKPLLATPSAWDGISELQHPSVKISEKPEVLAEFAIQHLTLDARKEYLPVLRDFVRAEYAWPISLEKFSSILASKNQSSSPSITPISECL